MHLQSKFFFLQFQQRLHDTSSTVGPGGISSCLPWRKKAHWHVCDYTKFQEIYSLGCRVSASGGIFAKFSHCSLILNSGVHWEFQQFQMKQSLTSRELKNNHKVIWIFHYNTIRKYCIFCNNQGYASVVSQV